MEKRDLYDSERHLTNETVLKGDFRAKSKRYVF